MIDLTLISAFYDAGINPLRKKATLKAISHWMEQSQIPDEMLFIELGFNGQFTFSPEDFPASITYIRIDGNDSNKYLFQKEHLWNMLAKRAKHDKLMFVDSDIAPLKDVDWFGKVSEALDKGLFTQGFARCSMMSERGFSIKDKLSYTRIFTQNLDTPLNVEASGMCFSIRKQVLDEIGYFNYLPLGGGDNLFWYEIVNKGNEKFWFDLFKRQDVKGKIDNLCKENNCPLLCDVDVDVCHFWHGSLKNRSYLQRQVLLMTQLPDLGNIICEGENGLLKWTDMNHYFVNISKNLINMMNDKELANEFIQDRFNYIDFENEINQINTSGCWREMTREQMLNKVFSLCDKYRKTPSRIKAEINMDELYDAKEKKVAKLKHVIQVRFLSQDFHNGWNLLDDVLINKCLVRMTSTLIPSLNNQINMDFEVVFLINPKLTFNQYHRIQKHISNCKPRFEYRFIPHNQYLQEYLNEVWVKNDIVVFTRVDDDDFVNQYVVQDTRDVMDKYKDFQVIVCGYNSGYKYIENKNSIRNWKAKFWQNGGNVSMFQSIITDTRKTLYAKSLNPLFCNHTKTMQRLPQDKYRIVYENIQRNDAFIRVVHENSAEYDKNHEKVINDIETGKNIKVTNELILKLKEDFAFTLKLDSDETVE